VRVLGIAIRVVGVLLLGLSLLGVALFFSSESSHGLGSSWTYDVWQPNGLNYMEVQVVDGLELCGLRLCYVRTSHSEFSVSRLWLAGWLLVKSEVVDPRGNSRMTQFDEGILLYRLPLRVGDQWGLEDGASRVTKAKAEHGGWVTREERISLAGTERRVVSVERVHVPAGTFNAYVVDHMEQNGLVTQRLWFDEGVGDAVRYIYGLGSVYYTRWELVDYQVRPRTVGELLYLQIYSLPMPAWLMGGLVLVVFPSRGWRPPLRTLFSGRGGEGAGGV
jgi:hypothetical protein